MPSLPIRGKIALSAAALTGLAVILFAVLTLLKLHQEQIAAVDVELVTEAQLVARLLASSDEAFAAIESPALSATEPWVAFAVVAPDGTVRRSLDSLPEPVVRAALPPGRPRTVTHDGEAWRVQGFKVGTDTVVVTFNLEQIETAVDELVFAYSVSLPFAVIVAALGGWWIAGQALAPVRMLTNAAAAISASNLDRRVPAPRVQDDIGNLARVLNAMLARLEGSFQQAERFAADASHELRTPLTIMRGEIEVLLRHDNLPPAIEQGLMSLQEEVDRLARIADNLLLLARLDAGQARAAMTRVDLSALVREACEDAEVLTTAHATTMETVIPPGLHVRGDAGLLRRLLLNLLANAAKYNVPGGRVRCSVTVTGPNVTIAVGNTGPGIPEELRPRLFERFFRADPARTESGHGLGLSLCREIARVHGGDVSLASASKSWTEFIVHLPHPD